MLMSVYHYLVINVQLTFTYFRQYGYLLFLPYYWKMYFWCSNAHYKMAQILSSQSRSSGDGLLVPLNGKWSIYMAPLIQGALQRLYIIFTHSHTHSYTDTRGDHARHQPSHREQLWVQSLAQGLLTTLTLGEPGIELGTF